MSRVRILGPLALALWTIGARPAPCAAEVAPAAQPNSARVLDEDNAVSMLAQHNPNLRVAMLALESARADVSGLEAQYATTLVLDASGTQTSTPSLFRSGVVSMNRIRRVDTGAELRKHLIWGTDLTLRVAGNIQYSQIRGGIFQIPGAGGVLPTGSTSASSFNFGPGYGVLGKLTLKQPLIRGRGADVGEAELRASRVDGEAKDRARRRIASELVRDALTAYWELWYAQELVRVTEEARGVAVAQRDDALARVRTGSLAPADALAFETAVATQDEALVSANSTLTAQRLALVATLGTVDLAPSDPLAVDTPRERYVFAGEVAEQQALSESPDIHERETAVQLARLQAKTAGDGERHRLDLEAYGQLQGLGNESVGDAANMFITGKAVSAFVGLTYEAPLTSQRQRAAAAKARLAIESADQELRAMRQRVLTDVRTALDAQSTADRKVELGERTVEIARRQRDAEQARFDSGSSTTVAVLKAEDDLRAAQQRLLRSRADAAESALKLEHLTGRLLARYARLARL